MKTNVCVHFLLSILLIRLSLSFGCHCGIERISKRIINGIEVQEGRYPWFAQINGCGAGLITDRHLITSAHCLVKQNKLNGKPDVKMDLKELKVVMGIHRKKDYETLPSLEVLNYVYHPEYKSEKYFYDIAIIKLKKKLEFINGLNPACLPNFDETDNMFAYGLGKQNNKNGKLIEAKVMHEVNLTRISSKECAEYYEDYFITDSNNNQIKREFDESLTMCSLDENKSVCEGDSGSPVSTRKDGQVYMVGIPSSVSENCLMDGIVWPTNYEKVYAHLDWIRQETKYGLYCQGKHHPFTHFLDDPLNEINSNLNKKRKPNVIIESDNKKPRRSARLNSFGKYNADFDIFDQ